MYFRDLTFSLEKIISDLWTKQNKIGQQPYLCRNY